MSSDDRLCLDDQLCFALYAASNAIVRTYRPLLREIGLTYPQYLVMVVLWQDGTSAANHIARRLSLPPNAVSPLLDRLEASGLILRQRDAGDRRVLRIALTPQGEALEPHARAVQDTVAQRTMLDPAAYAGLKNTLSVLTDELESGEERAEAAVATA